MMKLFLLLPYFLLYSMSLFAQNQNIEGVIENRLAETIVNNKCHLCHGKKGEGSSSIYPRLAGQHKEYMTKQLMDFRSGRRKGIMNEMAADLTNEEIFSLAEYFNSQSTLSHRVRDKSLALVGQYIFLKGNKYSGIEACATCHGERGHGTLSLPRLAGQHKRYVSSQLEEFNSRKRNNDNAIMHSIASKLTELEREAVALYVSGLK
jgi:cytochrome c553